ncbi:MAG: hypothetical protein GEU80_13520 [Dehalococcoidia bacterium]|nr:hypothetical protein [Dehalococcoidia bacterium]
MKRLIGLLLGAVVAATPALVAAQEGERALSTPADADGVIVITLLTLAAILLVAGLGYLYRRERKLDWDFQRPDTPQQHDH